MSHSHTAALSSNFQLIIDNALKAYKKQTKKDLLAHPLASQLQACDSPAAILAVLQQQVQELDQSRSSDDRWSKWLGPTVNILFSLSETLGEGVNLVSLKTRTYLRAALSYRYGRCSHQQKRYLLELASFYQCAFFLISPRSQFNSYIHRQPRMFGEAMIHSSMSLSASSLSSDVSRSTQKCHRRRK